MHPTPGLLRDERDGARVQGVYTGRPARLPDGRLSAIVKTSIITPLKLGELGLEGDEVADRRFHGGPEQALHQYPAEHYAVWAKLFPEIAALLVPGSIGENISAPGMTEDNVCIGDVFRWGDAEIQVSQPRMPCVKIDARFGVEGLTRAVMQSGHAGWYYRVLRAGAVAAGLWLELADRMQGAVSLAEFWATQHAHRPAVEQLLKIADAPGLTEKWRAKFRQRAQWLRKNPG